MNAIKKLATAAVALTAITAMTSCNSQKAKAQAEEQDAPKCLVLYYSQTGTTRQVAEELQKALGADIEAIDAEKPYTGSYDETIERCLAERESGYIPAAKLLKSNIADYDIIFLGYPIWFGTYAPPVKGLLVDQDFAGKKIVPFCTFGSGGLESSTEDLRKALPNAEILEGYGVRTARIDAMPAELNRFLIENGYVEGEVEPLPPFSEQRAVSAEEAKIFDDACGSYQFPLGTPVTVASRQVPGATEYEFIADSTTPDGKPARLTIYVLAGENTRPEFTRVVR